jgi:hypothetical protein
MLDFIPLPSGLIVNLAQIAWLSPAGDQIAISFTACSGSSTLQLNLDKPDATALLDALGQRHVNTNALRKQIGA